MNQPSQSTAAERRVIAQEILGQPTDFVIETRREADRNVITVTTVLPGMRWDGVSLRTYPPPRYPWTAAP
jgi:hypothetical protein